MSTAQAAETPQTVDQAIHAVKTHFSMNGIAKERQNSEQKYKFRGIDDVLNALSDALVQHRLNVLPRIRHKQTFESGKTAKGAAIHRTIVDAEFDLISVDDGSIRTVSAIGEAADSADKSGNKAMSFAYKYAMIQTFCIPTEGIDEGDYDHPEGQSNGNGQPRNGNGAAATEGPTDAQLVAFVDEAKARLKALTVGDGDKLEAILKDPTFLRRQETVKARNAGLYHELDHAIGMANAAVDDVPF